MIRALAKSIQSENIMVYELMSILANIDKLTVKSVKVSIEKLLNENPEMHKTLPSSNE